MSQVLNPPAAACRFHVRVLGFEPTIWRRIEVLDTMLVGELFQAAAVAVGYLISTTLDSTPLFHEDGLGRRLGDEPLEIGGDAPLTDCLAEDGLDTLMTLDLGGWQVEALFEGRTALLPGALYPRCTDGERAPIPGHPMTPRKFRSFLSALADPGHARHENALRRAKKHDPATFDLPAVNADLRRFCGVTNGATPREGRAAAEGDAETRARRGEHEQSRQRGARRVDGLDPRWLAKRSGTSKFGFNGSLVDDVPMRIFELLAGGSPVASNELSENSKSQPDRDGQPAGADPQPGGPDSAEKGPVDGDGR